MLNLFQHPCKETLESIVGENEPQSASRPIGEV